MVCPGPTEGPSWTAPTSALSTKMAQEITKQGGLTSVSFIMEPKKMLTLYNDFFKST